MNQQLLDRIENLLYAIENLYDQVFETNNLPVHVRDSFLEWDGPAVDFLRNQRDIIISRMNCGCSLYFFFF